MGASCCGGEEKKDKDANLMRNRGKLGKGKVTIDPKVMATIPLPTVVKMQSIMRGFLARKRIKKVYGYEMTPGLLNRGTVHIEMDPEKLEEQR